MQVLSQIFCSKILLIYNAFSLLILFQSIYCCPTAMLPLRKGNLAVAQHQGYPCAAVNNFVSYKSTKLFAIFQLLRCEIILLIPLSWDCIFVAELRQYS